MTISVILVLVGLVIFIGMILAFAVIISNKNKNKLQENDDSDKTEDSDLSRKSWPQYFPKEKFLSDAEFNFYRVLSMVIENGQFVNIKPRLCDLVSCKKDGFNKIKSKHVDFVVIDYSTAKPLYVIELDDKSHENEKVKERDSFVDYVLKSGNLRIIHVKARYNYSPEELKKIIAPPVNG